MFFFFKFTIIFVFTSMSKFIRTLFKKQNLSGWVLVQQVKPASLSGGPVLIPASLLPTQLSATQTGRHGTQPQYEDPCNSCVKRRWHFRFLLWPDSMATVVATGRMNQGMKDLLRCLSLVLPHSSFCLPHKK